MIYQSIRSILLTTDYQLFKQYSLHIAVAVKDTDMRTYEVIISIVSRIWHNPVQGPGP